MPRKKSVAETENAEMLNEMPETQEPEKEAVAESEMAVETAKTENSEAADIENAVVDSEAELPQIEVGDTIVQENAGTDVNKSGAEVGADEPGNGISEEIEKPNTPELNLGVLKLNVNGDDAPEDDKLETLWNEIVTFYRTRRIVPVIVTGIERTQLAGNVVVTYYKDQRILVPMTEMMINLSEERGQGYSIPERLERICNTMLGAEIDVMIKGMDKKNGSVVASRKDAMLRKREKFYLTPLSDGLPQVREGRVVEARIIGATQLVARLEVFGVETTMGASELSWDWLPNVADKFRVGDKINVLIKELKGDSVDNLKIVADIKSITVNTSMENLSKCSAQNKYIGEITNVRNGVAYLRLKVGVNAIAHTNYDRRTPAKGDVVSFVITRVNPEYGNVTGIITKIIKQSV